MCGLSCLFGSKCLLNVSIVDRRYVPPCKKVCMEELTSLVAATRVNLKDAIQEHLDMDGLDLSISGMPVSMLLSMCYFI